VRAVSCDFVDRSCPSGKDTKPNQDTIEHAAYLLAHYGASNILASLRKLKL
jgi:hypothetical protein